MKRPSHFRSLLIIILVLAAASQFDCKKDDPVRPPKVDDDEEYAIVLEVYRTGADFRAVGLSGSGSIDDKVVGIAGAGGVLLLKNPGFDRFLAIYTGVANNLTGISFADEKIMIAGMGMGLNDPGIIRQRASQDLFWSNITHSARGGITRMTTGNCAVTSVGEIMIRHPSPDWTVYFEDVSGPGFSGGVWTQGTVTAVGSSGRIFRNQTPSDYSEFIDETIPGGPDFSDVRYQYDDVGGLGAIWTAVGGREIWQRISGNWTRVLDSAPGDLYAINNRQTNVTRTIWAVGAGGTILEKEDTATAWTDVSVGADVTFRCVSVLGQVACGDDGAIYFNDPSGGWTDAGYANHSTWNDIDGLSSGEIYAANGDTLMGWDGISWSPVATNWAEIVSLHVVSSDRIWVVSSDGFDNFLHVWNGSSFDFVNQSSMDQFNSVWSDAGGSTAYVAANNGYVFLNGGYWDHAQADPSFRNIYGIYGTSTEDVYAVGESGLIVHYDGSGWTEMSTGVKDHTLRAIDGLVAVGDNGLVLRRSGSSWIEEDSGTTAHLYSVRYLSDKDIWAAGEGSHIIHYDGSKWSRYLPPLMTVDINTVWADAASPGDVWFGGTQGFLLKYPDL